MDIDLRAIGQLESVVADQHRQNSLKEPGKGREELVAPRRKIDGIRGKFTLNSVNAKLLPKHILGPSENVNMCLCP